MHPPVAPPASKMRTRRAIPSETDPLGVGDGLTNKDILCWLNQELWHMGSMNHVRGLLVILISRGCLGGCKLVNVAPKWTAWLGAVATLLWPIAMTKRGCIGVHITNLVVDRQGSFLEVSLTPMPPSYVSYMLCDVNANCAVQVIQPPGDDLEGVTQLPCPPVPPPPGTQVQGTLSYTHESVKATPTPLKCKDAFCEQSVEGPEPKAQPSMATPATDEDTRPKVLMHGEWCRCRIATPKMHPAS